LAARGLSLLDAGVLVTINPDDPAYFGGHVGDNYLVVQHALGLSDDVAKLAARVTLGIDQQAWSPGVPGVAGAA
jgi:adenosine deaminase